MGLDMYLCRDYYVKNWDHMSEAEKHTITILKGGEQAKIDVSKIFNIRTEEMYWRKANAIHAWFVDNAQEGVDNCGDYYVSEGQLQELLDDVTEALENRSLANQLLPTKRGFFFGGDDYDEHYFNCLEYTQRGLSRILADENDGEFYYHSSW